MSGRWARPLLSLLLATTLLGCRRDEKTVLLIVVTLQGSLPGVTALEVSISGGRGNASNSYSRPGHQPIIFPTTLSAEIGPENAQAPLTQLTIDVKATDSAGATVAGGREGPLPIRRGKTQTLSIRLDCGGASCAVDGGASDGAPGPDGATSDASPANCGNGVVDPGESCDVAIRDGEPGACPRADCDDAVACTADLRTGDACTLRCTHTEISNRIAGDGCCPARAQHADDTDCSDSCGNGAIEPTETCDIAIPAGQPGACPTAAECAGNDKCTATLLVSASTCSARCLRFPVVQASGAVRDGCCPVGALRDSDIDCPSVCGDGIKGPEEACDIAIATSPSKSGSCPTTCDDGDVCTQDIRRGEGCQAICAHVPITSFTSGDGCCPAGGNQNVDDDCRPSCGNNVLEEGEGCDNGRLSAAPCPTGCAAIPSACIRHVARGAVADCSVRCAIELVTTCARAKDGCCPAGCTAATDGDCLSTCGDGVVQSASGETCDTAIAAGAGSCPTQCSDGVACTRDILVSAGTCQARCVFVPVAEFKPGDGCCPPGGHFGLDPDCAPVCGNGVVETPVESCDFAIGSVACATACPASGGCSVTTLRGSAGNCSARCVTETITSCRGGDGCCPPACSSEDDSDCAAVCGNGVLEAGELCDKAITAGQVGACPGSCNDQDPCTVDLAAGTVGGCSRTCAHVPITSCGGGDRCCPAGCDASNDRDCGAVCGDGVIGGGETCDPPSSCPTVCPDDGDRCTIDRLTGDPARCNAACQHVPITTCSATLRDLCCPTGCNGTTDPDC
jgi:hypothetical protein